MKVKLLLTAITLSCLAIDVLAQVSISGKIVSADTNEPVVGANIRIDQSLSGCTTNGKGEFNINNLPDGQHVHPSPSRQKEVKRIFLSSYKTVLPI